MFLLWREPHDVYWSVGLSPDGATDAPVLHLQLETINLACQQHELRLPISGVRAAFFMGGEIPPQPPSLFRVCARAEVQPEGSAESMIHAG